MELKWPVLHCPVCAAKQAQPSALIPTDELSWQCALGHHFDCARQGYINLLPAQFKRSKDPGDSKLMVQARRRFLEAGYYAPIANKLSAMVAQHQTQLDRAITVLDAGCGEGYYLRHLGQQLPQETQLLGNDVSKWAVQAAAAAHKGGCYVVASNARLPYASHSLDVLICAFGFAAYEEFIRVLKPDGILLTVDPLPTHLQALRDILYEEQKSKPAQSQMQLEGFALQEQTPLGFELTLGQDTLQDLLTMTPHAYRAPQSGKNRLAALNSLQLDAEVVFQTWQPRSSQP